eukprot:2668348-Rhodomonas_salina.2
MRRQDKLGVAALHCTRGTGRNSYRYAVIPVPGSDAYLLDFFLYGRLAFRALAPTRNARGSVSEFGTRTRLCAVGSQYALDRKG